MEELRKYIDEMIYQYDPDENISCIRFVNNIVVTKTDIILRYDHYNGVICTVEQLENTLPDESGSYYFTERKALYDFIDKFNKK